MNTSTDQDRRNFLKSGAAITGSLVLGIQLTACGNNEDARAVISKLTQEKTGNDLHKHAVLPNAFLRIDADESITVYLPCVEMGQGVSTSLPMLIAEELEADWSSIKIEFAPAHEEYENPRSGRQITGGSASIRGFWRPMREAGALAREILLQAAAQTWKVEKSQCKARKGKITHQQTNAISSYGQLVSAASSIPLPQTVPQLKPAGQFTIIGQSVPRKDTLDKITGKALFGQDINIPDMLFASVIRSPVFEGKPASFDATPAMKLKGMINVFAIENGIAIVAKNYWTTRKARQLIDITWQTGELATLDSAAIRTQFVKMVGDGKEIETRGDTTKAFASSSNIHEAVYETPFLAHACMEPMSCTAHVQTDRCDVWVATQGPGPAQKAASKISGVPRNKTYIHTTYLGGGFGRRSETDFVEEAVLISKQLNKPVKVIWTREDDIQHDYYRPATYNRLTAALDHNGIPVAWQHEIAGASILHRIVPFAGLIFRGKDATSTEGADNLPYDIPNFKVTYAMVNSGIPVGFWRSVGNSQNAYVTECFLDELAAVSGKDPYRFRLELLKHQPKLAKVLTLAAEKSAWGSQLPDTHHRGIAIVKSFDSIVAYVAEVSIDKNAALNTLKTIRITAAVDCGTTIHPDNVIAQIESGIVYGLSAVLFGEITINKGAVEQGNFDTYPLLRMHEMPLIDVHLVKSAGPPGGVGEIGVPPIAPAVVNAVFAATGKPVRKLPFQPQLTT